MTINVQQAVMAAQNYFKSIKTMMGKPIQDLRLEEVELSEDKKYWLITLGFNHPINTPKNPLGIPGINEIPKFEREYKIFKIDSETGQVQSMKIREV